MKSENPTYYTTLLTAIALRKSPSHDAAMLGQILFGEPIEKLRNGLHFFRVKCLVTGQIGWVDRWQIVVLEDVENFDAPMSMDFIQPAFNKSESMLLSFGSRMNNFDGLQFHLNKERWQYSGSAIDKPLPPTISLLNKVCNKLLNIPYLKGGRSVLGIDSLGLLQLVYSCFGVQIGVDLKEQMKEGKTIDFISEAVCGDIVFFEDENGTPNHAGIFLGKGNIFHVLGKTKVDYVDHQGIFFDRKQNYSHVTKVIRRVTLFEKNHPTNDKNESIYKASNQLSMF